MKYLELKNLISKISRFVTFYKLVQFFDEKKKKKQKKNFPEKKKSTKKKFFQKKKNVTKVENFGIKKFNFENIKICYIF